MISQLSRIKEQKSSLGVTKSHNEFVLPIKLALDPMKHLIVISLKGDSEYEMLEPQLFDDKINGKGIRVLRYRKDKKVDVYWEPGVRVDPTTLSLGDGIGDFEETKFSRSYFEITNEKVILDVNFVDKQNRNVKICLNEKSTSKKRMSFLAPVGNDIKNPKQFFLAYMLDFDFLIKNETLFDISIGEHKLVPSKFPLLRNFKQVYFSRYSGRPAISVLNPLQKNLIIIGINPSNTIEAEGMKIEFDYNGNVSRLFIEENQVIYEIIFYSSFPNLLELNDSETIKGEWIFKIADSSITGGLYSLTRSDNLVQFQLDVLKHWNPIDLPLSFRVFTRLNSFFRRWPSTYTWDSTVDIYNMSISGRWRRKTK